MMMTNLGTIKRMNGTQKRTLIGWIDQIWTQNKKAQGLFGYTIVQTQLNDKWIDTLRRECHPTSSGLKAKQIHKIPNPSPSAAAHCALFTTFCGRIRRARRAECRRPTFLAETWRSDQRLDLEAQSQLNWPGSQSPPPCRTRRAPRVCAWCQLNKDVGIKGLRVGYLMIPISLSDLVIFVTWKFLVRVIHISKKRMNFEF